MTMKEAYEKEIADMQKQIHNLQLKIVELQKENEDLLRRSKLLDDLVYDRLMKK